MQFNATTHLPIPNSQQKVRFHPDGTKHLPVSSEPRARVATLRAVAEDLLERKAREVIDIDVGLVTNAADGDCCAGVGEGEATD